MEELDAAVSIAHVTTVHSLVDNRIRRKECAGLAANGFSVFLIGPGKPAIDSVDLNDGVTVIRTARRSGRFARAVRGTVDVWRRLWGLNPHVVHAHDPELIPLLIAYKMARPRTMTIYDAHEDLVAQVRGKGYLAPFIRPAVAFGARVLEKAVAWSADIIVVATPHIAELFHAARSVVVLQNFPLHSDYKDYCAPSNSTDLVYVGGLTRSRGSEQILEAMELLPREIGLKIVGPVEDNILRQFEASAANVEHLGSIDAKKVPQFISTGFAGLVLFLPHPNHYESQPTKLFEYMASGIPFIASDFPHWRKITEPFKCGIFVDPTSPDDIAAAIQKLVNDPVLCREMGEAGRELMTTRFSFEAELAHFLDELSNRGITVAGLRPAGEEA